LRTISNEFQSNWERQSTLNKYTSLSYYREIHTHTHTHTRESLHSLSILLMARSRIQDEYTPLLPKQRCCTGDCTRMLTTFKETCCTKSCGIILGVVLLAFLIVSFIVAYYKGMEYEDSRSCLSYLPPYIVSVREYSVQQRFTLLGSIFELLDPEGEAIYRFEGSYFDDYITKKRNPHGNSNKNQWIDDEMTLTSRNWQEDVVYDVTWRVHPTKIVGKLITDWYGNTGIIQYGQITYKAPEIAFSQSSEWYSRTQSFDLPSEDDGREGLPLGVISMVNLDYYLSRYRLCIPAASDESENVFAAKLLAAQTITFNTLISMEITQNTAEGYKVVRE